MLYIILLLNEHRILVAWILALSLWVAAYYWYFRGIIRGAINRGRPHNWSVDMATKTTRVNGREEIY